MNALRAGLEGTPARALADRFTAWDGALVAVLLSVTVAAALALGPGGEGAVLEVRVGEGAFSYPLGLDGVHALDGPLGRAELVVREGRATLRNAPCPTKLCEAMGAVSRPGDAIICIPNRIVVTVAGPRDVDAVSR